MSDIECTEGELESICFSIPGQPFGKQRPRVVNRGGYSKAYTPQKTVSYENLVKICFDEKARGHRFKDNDMLEVKIVAYYEIPKSTSNKKRNEMLSGRILPGKKPDWDNIGKIVCDSLNGIAYHDDAAIVKASVLKFYSEKPRVDVKIRRIHMEQ